MTMRSASKSTPAPTWKLSIAETMLATSPCPAERSASTTVSFGVPSGKPWARDFETTPSKMMLVALPRTRGASTASTTPIAPRNETKAKAQA